MRDRFASLIGFKVVRPAVHIVGHEGHAAAKKEGT